MKKRSLFMGFAALLAIGSALIPSALSASAPYVVRNYGGTTSCPLTRNCPGGNTFCGYQFETCTGSIFNMAP